MAAFEGADLGLWLRQAALPFWAEAGQDAASGLFHECLLTDGRPERRADRRVRVQARQIYTFAHAAVLGWHPAGAALALRAFDALLPLAENPDGAGGFVHRLRPDGSVADPLRDAYDHAFLVLAFAWLHRATGEARVAAALERVLAFVDQTLTSPDGALIEGTGARLPRRQNPQMHWFEAMQALAALGHPEGAARAARFRALFERHFFDAEAGLLGEYFTESWQPAPGQAGLIVEPGHQAEWVWLLRRHDALSGADSTALVERLLAAALRWRDHETGLLVDEALRDGTVLTPTRRSWLQTELVKAWLAEAEAGRPGARAEAVAALETLRRAYLGRPLPGGWIDRLDAAGKPVPAETIQASTFYHIFLAGVEADRVLGPKA